MQARFVIRNKKLGIGCEAEKTDRGYAALATLRKVDKRFQRRPIIDIFQALPDQVPLNEEGRSEIIVYS